MSRTRTAVFAATLLLLAFGQAAAATMEFVTVGNPGNPSMYISKYRPIMGGVDYVYRIGKFEVTNDQYTEFLNAVAGQDDYGLYNGSMRINRVDTGSGYAYTATPNYENHPILYVSWLDAARFCNWMTNGKPTGLQNADTTETGSYQLNGIISNAAAMTVVRDEDGRYFLPTYNEWFKAAYHKNDGSDEFWRYPTQFDYGTPSQSFDSPYAANYGLGTTTPVGAYTLAGSAYGTFDQGGNAWEWTEGGSGSKRWIFGGSCRSADHTRMQRGYYYDMVPTSEFDTGGFRIVDLGTDPPAVPEPATAIASAAALAGLVRYLRKRRTD